MSKNTPRAIDPANSVQQALSKARGFTSQADVREDRHAIQRQDGIGDNPNNLTGPVNINGNQTMTGGLLRIEVINDDVDGLIVGPVFDPGVGDYYTMSYLRESGLYVFKLLNGGGFPSFQITQETNGDSTVEILSGVLNVYDGLGNVTFGVDASGNITTAGKISGPVAQLWNSGAHHDPGATTLSVVGMTAWTTPATMASNDGTAGSYLNFQTGAVSGNVSGPNGPLSYRPDWTINCVNHVRIVDTANVRMHIGLYASDPSGSASPTINMAGFRYDTGLGESTWKCRTADGAAGASVDSGVTVGVGSTYFRMLVTTTSVKFYIDDVLVATKTTNLPTSNALLAPYCRVTTLAAAAKSLGFGYFSAVSQ